MSNRIPIATALMLCLGTAAQAEGPNKLLAILTAPGPQTQLMAMALTMNAMATGSEVEMLLCGPAGDIALKGAPASATAGQPPKGCQPARLDEDDAGKEQA